jgi:hypothetical protein
MPGPSRDPRQYILVTEVDAVDVLMFEDHARRLEATRRERREGLLPPGIPSKGGQSIGP